MPGLREIVFRTRGHKASDTRDQVYALYGMIKYAGKGLRLPATDYNKSVSQIYQETMAAIMNESKNFESLLHAPAGRNSSLPSWCADFSKQTWNILTTPERTSIEEGGEATELFEINYDHSHGTSEVHEVALGEVILPNKAP